MISSEIYDEISSGTTHKSTLINGTLDVKDTMKAKGKVLLNQLKDAYSPSQLEDPSKTDLVKYIKRLEARLATIESKLEKVDYDETKNTLNINSAINIGGAMTTKDNTPVCFPAGIKIASEEIVYKTDEKALYMNTNLRVQGWTDVYGAFQVMKSGRSIFHTLVEIVGHGLKADNDIVTQGRLVSEKNTVAKGGVDTYDDLNVFKGKVLFKTPVKIEGNLEVNNDIVTKESIVSEKNAIVKGWMDVHNNFKVFGGQVEFLTPVKVVGHDLKIKDASLWVDHHVISDNNKQLIFNKIQKYRTVFSRVRVPDGFEYKTTWTQR